MDEKQKTDRPVEKKKKDHRFVVRGRHGIIIECHGQEALDQACDCLMRGFERDTKLFAGVLGDRIMNLMKPFMPDEQRDRGEKGTDGPDISNKNTEDLKSAAGFNVAGTQTGRFSCEKPNDTNTSKADPLEEKVFGHRKTRLKREFVKACDALMGNIEGKRTGVFLTMLHAEDEHTVATDNEAFAKCGMDAGSMSSAFGRLKTECEQVGLDRDKVVQKCTLKPERPEKDAPDGKPGYTMTAPFVEYLRRREEKSDQAGTS